MVSAKVKALFEFIDFLDKNKKKYIETYLPLTNELVELDTQRNLLSPQQNFKDKQRYDSIQREIDVKLNPLENNVIVPILNKLKELKIWDGADRFISIYNNNANAALELTKNFTDKDIKEVKKYKQKYLSFRTETNSNFILLDSVFENLDETLKVLFDFFKNKEKNEFERYETKAIQVNKDTEEKKEESQKLFAETLPDLGEYVVFSHKALQTTLENYFYVWRPKEIPIDEEIERNKELQEMRNVSTLQAAKKAGEKTTIGYSTEKITPEKFDVFYDVKLKEFLKKIDFSIEKDFIEDELKKCRLWSDKMPEKKLMKRWIEFSEKKLSLLLNEDKSKTLPFQKTETKKDQENKPVLKDKPMIFDLTKYNLQSSTVIPYFKIISKQNEYHIYEGAIGNNRFQYYKISKKSNAGKLCKQYDEKYISGNEKRNSDYFIEDRDKLFTAINYNAIESENGLDAYLKYWKDCFTKEDKLHVSYHAIPHFEALKEWYNLKLNNHIENNECLYLNEDVKKADIEKWKNNLAKEIEQFLKVSQIPENRNCSSNISSVHANEVIKFHEYQTTETKSEQQNSNLDFVVQHLKHLRAAFNNEIEYLKALQTVANYFSGNSLNITQPIFVKNGNIKNLAFALGEIWRSKKNDVISYEYLRFYKQAFSNFKDQSINQNNLFGSTLYKYSISKT